MRFSLFLRFCCIGLSAAGFVESNKALQIRRTTINTRSIPQSTYDDLPTQLLRRAPAKGGPVSQNQLPSTGRGAARTRSSGAQSQRTTTAPTTPSQRQNSQTLSPPSNLPGPGRASFFGPGPSGHGGSGQPNESRDQGQSRPSQHQDLPPGLQRPSSHPRQTHDGQGRADMLLAPPGLAAGGARRPQQPVGALPAQALAISQGSRGHYFTTTGRPGQMDLNQNRRPIPQSLPWSAVPAQASDPISATAGVAVPRGSRPTFSRVSAFGTHGAVTTVNGPHGTHAQILSLRQGSPPRLHILPNNGPSRILDQRAPNGRLTTHHTTLIGSGTVISQGYNIPLPPDGTPGHLNERLQQLRNNRIRQVSLGHAAAAA